jgi:hypothetical protein
MRIAGSIGLLAACVLLAACAEKPQTTTRKADGRAYEGTNDGHSVPGWKAGDAASWEQQMKNRAQGQNEYTRTSAP